MPPMLMSHSEDPRDEIYKKIGLTKDGVIPGFTLFGNRVLLGVYERPSRMKPIKTASGEMVSLHIPDTTRDEDKHQGKAAVVLMKGPTAFVSDAHYDFQGQNVEVGDWVTLWVGDGRRLFVNGQLCRIIRDQDINMKIPSPDQVF